MIKYLEDLLHEKTKDTQSGILFAQWNYDKKVVPTALQAVSNLFPHYSLHDESHSITIINNIVRVLGKENMTKLSAIDIWLILEASYCHDIGMVVSSEKLVESINSPKFIEFFKELIEDKKNGLHEFAIQFQIVDNKIRYKDDLFNLELNDGIKFILAEFFRRIHAERSKEIINNPLNELSLLSPRGVIPPRIFKILGDICSCHTKDFSDVLKLPFSEVGIDIEDAHPRFIACLLRVGDLLDLDNNRFSEVMLRTLTRIPVDTLNHKAKHLSIESFRVDRDRIEITANCQDYDTANITQHWFNYLNSEISSQMINWNDIVPFKELGYLPTIGNLKVELSNYDFIDGKHKPKFSVDTDKALGLLQGAGIYDGPHQCIREILQNAVDATLVRIWLEHKNDKDFSSPHSADFLKLIADYPIKVKIKEKGVVDTWQNWEIEIEDKGTGISSNDLKFLMNTGSSSKNRERISIIESMPTWMKPSGTFGIGFQSIFMLTEFVKIETKSFFDEQFQVIELNGPNSKKDGDILIQKKKTTHAVKPGTKIIINYKTKAVPNGYSINNEHSNANRIAYNYDPFTHESLDIEMGKVLDETFVFAHKSYLPIKLEIDGKDIKTYSYEKSTFDYFDPENSLEITINDISITNRRQMSTFYKNQKADSRLSIEFLGFDINIHKNKASEVLSLNRNKIKEEYYPELIKDIFKTSFKIITENFENIFKTEDEKAIGSMYLNYYHSRDEMKGFDIKKFNQWQNLSINVDDKKIQFEELIKSIDSLRLIHDHAILSDTYKLDKKELTISISRGGARFEYTKFFLFKASEYFTSIKKITETTKVKEELYTKEKQGSPYSKEDLSVIIKNLKNGRPYSARAIIPCIEEFFILRIKDSARESYVYHYLSEYSVFLPIPKMLSPLINQRKSDGTRILKLAIPDKLLEWVYLNRYDSKTTKEQIKEGYDLFCKDIDLDAINKE